MTKEKSAYPLRSNLAFMLAQARRDAVSTLWLSGALVLLQVAQNLTQLFLAPVILRHVETAAPVGTLLGVIAAFTAGTCVLTALISYAENVRAWPLIEVRSGIVNDINAKAGETSYVNLLDPRFRKLREQARMATSGNDQATEEVWRTLTTATVNALCFAIYLLLLRNLHPLLLAAVLATTVVSYLLRRKHQRWVDGLSEERSGYYQRLGYVEQRMQDLSLAKDIRMFGLADWLMELKRAAFGLLRRLIVREERGNLWIDVADVLFALGRNGLAYAVLLRMAISGGMPASEFLLYFSAVGGFTSWMTRLMNDCATLSRQSVDLGHVREFLDFPEPFRFFGGEPIPKADAWELRLEHVSFRYPGAEKDAIHGVDLTIRPGEKVAVVGLNGAGKTTLVKLLCGFLDPTEGRVLLNGTDIRVFNRQEYYALFSAVFQEFSVLNVSVARNVSQTVEGYDQARVEDCLRKAGLLDFVASLPKGLETHVGREVYLDGELFSGGQTQRLMLARALYKDGPLLMLDEPTAALDPLAENDIYLRYNEMTQGKTAVFISHRLASTRFCDRILYLEDGRIAEEGTHETLLQKGGGYAKLFEVQSRYYREGRDF